MRAEITGVWRGQTYMLVDKKTNLGANGRIGPETVASDWNKSSPAAAAAALDSPPAADADDAAGAAELSGAPELGSKSSL